MQRSNDWNCRCQRQKYGSNQKYEWKCVHFAEYFSPQIFEIKFEFDLLSSISPSDATQTLLRLFIPNSEKIIRIIIMWWSALKWSVEIGSIEVKQVQGGDPLIIAVVPLHWFHLTNWEFLILDKKCVRFSLLRQKLPMTSTNYKKKNWFQKYTK